jgi:hypothetical protein
MPASPSLLIVPARFKTGKLYTQIATTSAGVVLGSSGDFNVTRATTATRVNANGLIESVASGVPRLDYYTSGGTAGCPALLVEASAANGILNSANTTTDWALGVNLSSGYVDVIGVSGNNLTVAASGSGIGSSTGALRRTSNNVALASGSTYTISFLMRQTGTHTIGGYYAAITGGAAGDLGGGFNVSGSFSSGSLFVYTGATNRIRRVERFGADVYRCSETFTMTASGTLTTLSIGPTVSVTSDTNSASGTTMAFAAPQIELGAIPTSFIPTTAAAVTRNADVINLSGAVSGCIGQTEGTIYAEVDIRTFANVGMIATISDGTASNRVDVYKNTDSKIYFDRFSSTGTTTGLGSAALTTGIFKVAVAYKSGDTTMYINGTQVGATQTQTFTFSSLTKITIGVNRADTALFFNDRIRSAALYTTRLTNAELAALTTL